MTDDQPSNNSSNINSNNSNNTNTNQKDGTPHQSSPPPRRSSTATATGTATATAKHKSSTLTLAQETTFLNMQLRKMNRALTGTVQRNRTYELAAVMILLVALYGAGGWYSQTTRDEKQSNGDDDGRAIRHVVVSLTLGDCLAIGVWLFVAVVVTSVFEKSKFIELLYWMVVYLPLLTLVSILVLGNQIDSDLTWIIIFIAVELVAVLVFLVIYWLYPHILNSGWVRQRNGRVQKLWKVRTTAGLPWTFSYRRRKGWLVPQRHSCRYEGATSPATGLPHGRGRWFDDAVRDGEVVTGWWRDGVPVAPFVSRQYGSGDVLKCVRLAYVSGSDDDFATTRFWPDNATPMRCGLAMVECSVSGKFYNNLPHAQNMSGYRPFDVKTSMGELLSELVPGDDDKSGADGGGGGADGARLSTGRPAGSGITETVEIVTSSSTNGGVSVRDHVHAGTGKPYDPTVREIVIKVERVGGGGGTSRIENGAATGTTTTTTTSMNGGGIATSGFMPRCKPERLSIFQQVFGQEEEYGDEDADGDADADGDDGEVEELASIAQEGKTNGTETKNPAKTSTAPSTTTASPSSPRNRQNGTRLNLIVMDWLPAKHREVLIFIPGFNCSLEGACQSFGQLLSMTKLDEMRIHPVLYSWPCGQVLSYHSASRKSQSERNHAHFASFLQGLRNAGVTSVHLMSHSMGVQTLLGSLCDLPDGSRSAASKCFRLASSDDGEGDEPKQLGGNGNNNNNNDIIPKHGSDLDSDELDEVELEAPLLVCKTLTMLNPDYPLDAFVNHAFASARRLCDVVTIVGDKNDQALFFSQTVNGMAVRLFGYEQPRELQPNDRNRQKLCKQPVIGRCIEDLYFPVRNTSGSDSGRAFPVRYDTSADIPDQLLFQDGSQFVLGVNPNGGGGGGGRTGLDIQELLWLDVDVIDCTGLDTNIAGIRHSAYNLNPVLLKDLTELISSGQRAMKRTSLLYRDGNIFSYAYAPSYVAY